VPPWGGERPPPGVNVSCLPGVSRTAAGEAPARPRPSAVRRRVAGPCCRGKGLSDGPASGWSTPLPRQRAERLSGQGPGLAGLSGVIPHFTICFPRFQQLFTARILYDSLRRWFNSLTEGCIIAA
ncbi:hypothetical protein LCGC14_1105740, partial [marine sediment metagenome]